jgi:hypothetical protein
LLIDEFVAERQRRWQNGTRYAPTWLAAYDDLEGAGRFGFHQQETARLLEAA